MVLIQLWMKEASRQGGGAALPGSVRTFDVSNHFMEVMEVVEVWRRSS